jgi:hypothetical protein
MPEPNPPASTPPIEDHGLVDSIASGESLDELFSTPAPSTNVPLSDGKDSKPEPDKPDPRFASLEERLGKLDEELAVAKQHNTYLQGVVNTLQSGQKPSETKDEPKPFVFNKDQFASDLEKDPAGAIMSLVQLLTSHQGETLRGELRKDVDGKLTLKERQTSLQSAYESDKQQTLREFGEDVVLSDAFKRDADVEFAKILNARGGKGPNDYLPGDLYSAAAVTYGKWARDGKLPKKETSPASVNGSPTQSQPTLRSIIERMPRSDMVANGNGRPTSNGVPKTIDELPGMSDRDKRAARIVIQRQGIDEATFVRNSLAAAAEDGEYGR